MQLSDLINSLDCLKCILVQTPASEIVHPTLHALNRLYTERTNAFLVVFTVLDGRKCAELTEGASVQWRIHGRSKGAIAPPPSDGL